MSCKERGCKRPIRAHGLCEMHYKRAWRARGGPAVDRNRAAVRAYKAANREQMRAYDAEYGRRPENRGTCSECGGPKGARGKHYDRCQACITAEKERFYRAIQLMWEDGLKFPEIMETLRISKGYLASSISRMRVQGWDMPHRYKRKAAA